MDQALSHEPASRAELAWAAGFFDGDGCFTVKRRRDLIAVISQSGRSGLPSTLERFQAAVGVGRIWGLSKWNLSYSWMTSATEETLIAATMIWPWLGEAKRRQLALARSRLHDLRRDGRPIGPRSRVYRARRERLDELEATLDHAGVPRPISDLPWAAGLFDAEGSTFNRRERNGPVKIAATVGQADPDGVPELLLRLRAAVGMGRVNGPYLSPGRIPHYVWQVAAYGDVVQLHRSLAEWLGTRKRSQAMAAVDAYRAHRAARGTDLQGLEPLIGRDLLRA